MRHAWETWESTHPVYDHMGIKTGTVRVRHWRCFECGEWIEEDMPVRNGAGEPWEGVVQPPPDTECHVASGVIGSRKVHPLQRPSD